MALAFPSSPTMGQQYTAEGRTWEWDGTRWLAKQSSTPIPIALGGTNATTAAAARTSLGVDDQLALKLDKTGGTLTGRLNVEVGSSDARFVLSNTASGVDRKRFRVMSNADDLTITPLNDAQNAGLDAIKIDGYADGAGVTIGTKLNVPDATADGQALAYDQANAVLKSLIISDTNSGYIQLQDEAYANADHRKWRIISDWGQLQFRRVDSADTTLSPVMLISDSDDVDMSAATSVTVPAISGANQAAQVTAYDAATGRLAIGGVEMGNTGWRTIASWTAGVQDAANQVGVIRMSSWTLTGDGAIRVRRRGGFVEAAFIGSMVSTSASTVPLFDTVSWPAGFRFGTTEATGGTGSTYIPVFWRMQRQTSAADVRVGSGSAGDDLHGAMFVISSGDSWPTSLPGIQYTAPFTG